MSLDKFDLRLIQEIENDTRQSLSKIAKKIHSSQQNVSYRLKVLEKNGVIGGYYTIIDLTKLGYTSYRTMIRLSNINDQKHNEIISCLIKHENVLWLVECGGRWDLIVNFLARNIGQFDVLFKEFKHKFPMQIQNYDVLPTVQVISFGRDYFSKYKREIKYAPSFGHSLEVKGNDTLNLKILKIIAENARMNSVEIGEELGISPNTVILRMKEMRKKGIIQGYRPLIHLEKTPFRGYKALIKFQNFTESKEREIIEYLRNNINIVGIIKLVGLWDFEIEFEIDSQEGMLLLTRSFRDKFKDIIKEFEVIPLFHEYKYNFFPGDLLARI